MAHRTLSSGTRLSNVVASLALALLLPCLGAQGADRSAYKYLDEKGSVVYSQTPPAGGKDAKKIDISPARPKPVILASGTAVKSSAYDSSTPVILASGTVVMPNARRDSSEGQEQDLGKKQEELKKAEIARRNLRAELEAECTRNRGTDCKNPETLVLMESSRIPR